MDQLPKLSPYEFGFDREELGFRANDGSYFDSLFIAAPNVTWGYAEGKITNDNVEEVFENWDRNNRTLYLFNGGKPIIHLVDYGNLPIPSIKVKNVANRYFNMWFNEGIMGHQAIINAPAVYQLIGKFLGDKNPNIKRTFYKKWDVAISSLNIMFLIENADFEAQFNSNVLAPPDIFLKESQFMGNLIPFPPGCFVSTNGIGKVFIYQIRKNLFYTFSYGDLTHEDFKHYIKAQIAIGKQNPNQELFLINNSLHLSSSSFKSRKMEAEFVMSAEYPFKNCALITNGLTLISAKIIQSFNSIFKERLHLFNTIEDAFKSFSEEPSPSYESEPINVDTTIEEKLELAQNQIKQMQEERNQNIEWVTHALGGITWNNQNHNFNLPTNINENPYKDIYYSILLVNTDLREIISDRDDYLKKIETEKEKAEGAVKTKASFLSTMSHEIRTPLNAVIGLSEILIDENNDPKQLDNLETLANSGKNLLSLINDILDFSKIESDLELENHTFSITYLINSISKAFTPMLRQKDLVFNTHISEELQDIQLKSDSTRLTQILNNLIGNSVKFTQEGEISLYVTELSRSDKLVKIQFQVLDSGIGIKESRLSSIWDEFTQISQSGNRQFGGSGLGLTITKKLIEMFHGNVTVESQEGVGTQFSFEITFPYEKINLNVIQDIGFDETTLIGLKVLVIDDNHINLKVANKHLEKFGCATTLALSGSQAILLYQKSTFDIILMDLQMPIMDGFETAQELISINPNAKIIALTADVFPETKERVTHSSMISYLTKPIIRKKLFSELSKIHNLKSPPFQLPPS